MIEKSIKLATGQIVNSGGHVSYGFYKDVVFISLDDQYVIIRDSNNNHMKVYTFLFVKHATQI
jgi:hypothetical protein